MIFFKGTWGLGHSAPPRKLIESALVLYLSDSVVELRSEISKYRYMTGERKTVKKAREPGFCVLKRPSGMSVEVLDDVSIWATIYEKRDGVIVKRHKYNKEKKFFISSEVGFKDLSLVLFVKYVDGSVVWREVSNKEIEMAF